jgi:uncharacterized protein YjgD (DUF1641 family)
VAEVHQETRHSPPQPVGFLGLLRAMRDPQIQQAVGVLLHVARRFGEHVQQAAKES